jgi:hypothetical protein
MVIDEMAYTTPTTGLLAVTGIGVFTPNNGKPKATLGVACDISQFKFTSQASTVACQGGVTQDFPDLGLALGSVSPLTLNLKGFSAEKITFSGSRSQFVTGPLGSLGLTQPTHTTLGISGNPTPFGSSSAKGEAGSFVLFPPRPTDWAVTDAQHKQKFSIAVVDDATRGSAGKVVETDTGATLAILSVDQSGSGNVKYLDGLSVPVSSWLLGE